MKQYDKESLINALLAGCKIHSSVTAILILSALFTMNTNFYIAAAFTCGYMCYTFFTAYYIWNLKTVTFLTAIVIYTSVIPNCYIGAILYLALAKVLMILTYIAKKIGGEK